LDDLTNRQAAFGYSREEIKFLFEPMALERQEPVSSMGDDTPLAVLSHLPRLLPTYFKQRFAQVTNPPIDPIREKLVMSLKANLGKRLNWLDQTPEHARQIELAGPVVTRWELQKIEDAWGAERMARLQCVFPIADGPLGFFPSLMALCEEAEVAVDGGAEILILSDTAVDAAHAPIPMLLAVGAVNNHLLKTGRRLRTSVIAESGEPREVHHFATLIGYGASAVHPYLAIQTIAQEVGDIDEGFERRLANFIEIIDKGLLKVMSKMGISTLSSYRGAQIFEAIGLSRHVIETAFPNTPSPVGGIGFEEIAREALLRHESGFVEEQKNLADLGYFRYRRGGEIHAWSPKMLGAMGKFRKEKPGAYAAFSKEVSERTSPIHLRDLLKFRRHYDAVSVDEVEPIEAIRTRFTTAAMSLGALSPEAHEAIAIAMNRIGGKSNTGEGGEDRLRYIRKENGDSAESAIKQVASGRFGVTPEYLVRAQELEIKMAQGSKPGEGGQLPGHKVTEYIAYLRHATPGIPLISPPPHHDIYSIEDLAQLIYDLKQINPGADICVKLVAEAGVGTIAAGVAKAYADVILISGHDGGTGASPLSSIKNAGSAWEIGLAEVQQVLVLNGLRERVKLRADGGLKTGRDIVI
ncbi:MAG: glutamate synthase-related protein, partial [Bradymonadaceae bacterium]